MVCLIHRDSESNLIFARSDNDMYDHMNNSVYSFLYVSTMTLRCCVMQLIRERFDSIINTYLIEQCGLQPPTSMQIGLVVHSHCDFFGSVAFPSVVDVALRVNKLGKASVIYEVAIFEHGVEDPRAVGSFTHVFVDRNEMRPMVDGMPSEIRTGLQRMVVSRSFKL